METVAEIGGEDIPQITVEMPLGSVLKNGADPLDFGKVSLGRTSISKTLTVINRGGLPLIGK